MMDEVQQHKHSARILKPLLEDQLRLVNQQRMFAARAEKLLRTKTKLVEQLREGRAYAKQLKKRGCSSTVRPWRPHNQDPHDWQNAEYSIVPRLNKTEDALQELYAKRDAIFSGHKGSIYGHTPEAARFLGKSYKAKNWKVLQQHCECSRCRDEF